MTKLCQIVAVEKGLKAQARDSLTKAHHSLLKPDLLAGFSRTYTPFTDAEAERLPPEHKVVQVRATDTLQEVTAILTRAWDATATKEWGNTLSAKADIVVEGVVLAKDVPVAFLLHMEHQLDDLQTFVDKLPTLDPSEVWAWDANQALYATSPQEVLRTRKVPTVITKAPATEHHPAQTEIWPEDKPVGKFTMVKRSGALPVTRVNELRERVRKLQAAVKFAREQANTVEITQQTPASVLLGFIFGT